MATHHEPAPITGYSEGLIKSDSAPRACLEHFRDGRPPNANLYFEIDGRYYNVHPYRFDLDGYPVRWIDNSAPIGWTD